MARRKVGVVTGTRADYGLLRWLMQDLRDDGGVELQVLATGMHLSPEFGLTVHELEADGFVAAARVEMLLSADTPVAIAKSVGLGVIGFADALERLRPDVLVVLGDRFEILAAVQAALLARIPVAHVHGGERTEGAVDESIRHAITKMAQLHFVAAEPYRRRVVQMGESPERVFNLGAPGLDALTRLPLLDRAALEARLSFRLSDPTFLVTFHPETLVESEPAAQFQHLLDALDAFPHAQVLLTRPNADTHGRALGALIDNYVAKRPGRALAVTSLGHQGYLSALKACAVVVGNSSSGIIEAPAVGCPTVNVGDRQAGRLRAASILDVPCRTQAIIGGIARALSPEFRAGLQSVASVYGQGNASRAIAQVLKKVDLAGLARKQFHDVPERVAL